MINSIVWFIAGAIIGVLVTFVIRRRRSILLLNIIVGGFGALVVGYLLSPLLQIDTTSFSWMGMLVSLGVTMGLLVVANFIVREHTVTNAVLESQWNKVRIKIHNRWNRLSNEDIDQIDGKHDRLIHLLEERYGITNKVAEEQLQGFLRAVTTKVSWLSILRNRALDQ